LSIILARSTILYVIVVFAVRLMGKRQIGELQPSELVITILVSNIATLPLEDSDIPLSVGITPILSLVCFEVIVSSMSLVFPKLRKVMSGSPKVIISDGKIDTGVLKELRFSVDDLMTALRNKDVFDLNQVQFAIVETTGTVSVMKKSGDDIPTRSDLGISIKSSDPPKVVVSDGTILSEPLSSLGISTERIKSTVKKYRLDIQGVFLMTADSDGNFFIADRKGNVKRGAVQ